MIPRRREAAVLTDIKLLLEPKVPTLSTDKSSAFQSIETFKNAVVNIFRDVFEKVKPPFARYGYAVESAPPQQRTELSQMKEAYLNFQSHIRFPEGAAIKKEFLQLTESSLEDAIEVCPTKPLLILPL